MANNNHKHKKNKEDVVEEQDLDENSEEVEHDEIKDELEDVTDKYEELEHRYKRALADYQNLEKRVRDDRGNWIKAANKELIARMLPVLDTLMLAAKHTEDQGIQMTVQQFIQVLEQEGAQKIKTEEEQFDPNAMEAVEIVQGNDNIVMEEVRPGFIMHGQVIRPAQVKVGKQKE